MGGMADAVHGCVFIVLRLADIRHSSFSSKISTLKGAALLTSYASPGHSRRRPAGPLEEEEEEEEEEDWDSCDRRWEGENCTTHLCVRAVCVSTSQ